MARTRSWWFHRLRAMSLAEVAHRSWRLARHPIDREKMRTGRFARLPVTLLRWNGPTRFYFTADQVSCALAPRLHERAEAICRGEREVLGLGRVQLPQAYWHYEPLARCNWPVIDAARVMRAAPAHLDARITWELNRGHDWVVLARAHAGTSEERFRSALHAELESWRRANPIGVGINWASPMEAAIRIHSLAWVSGFARGSIPPGLATMIFEHATFVAANLSRFSSANNHLIVELSGLVIAGRILGIEHWHRSAVSHLEVELIRQVYPDGVNAEMATHYHVFVLEALLLVAWLERAYGERCAKLEEVARRMAEYLTALRCSDGSLLQQGDNDDGSLLPFFTTDHASQLIDATRALACPTELSDLVAEGEGLFWLTGGRMPPAATTPPRSRAFRESGQIVLASERMTATFDAGSFGFGSLAAHAHCDALAVNVAIDGRPIFVDRGTYRYNGDPRAREHFRSTAAHNTLQVGTREQADSAGPFLWSRRPTVTLERCELGADGDVVRASHDGFAPITHRRTIVHRDGILLVLDEAHGAATATTRFHGAPGLRVLLEHAPPWTACITEHGCLLTNAPGVHVRESHHSERYMLQATAPTIECSAPPSGVVLSVIAPRPAGTWIDLLPTINALVSSYLSAAPQLQAP